MRVIKWEPFRDVDDVFERFFAETMRRWPRAGGEGQQSKEWAPMADVSETDGEYIIKAELSEVRNEHHRPGRRAHAFGRAQAGAAG